MPRCHGCSVLWMGGTLGRPPAILWPPRASLWSLSSCRSLAGWGSHIVSITKETTRFVCTCSEWGSHLKSSAQTMRIALWSQERNEGNKNYLETPASIYPASHCNSAPRDRRCIYVPPHSRLFYKSTFLCLPTSSKQAKQLLSDSFLIPTLVRVSWRAVPPSMGRSAYGFLY